MAANSLKLKPFPLKGWATEAYYAGAHAYGTSTHLIQTTAGVHGIDEVISNLRTIKQALAVRAARTLALIGLDLLSHSVKRAPRDTGELRESGSATLYIGGRPFLIGVGTGTADVTGDFSSITKETVQGNTNIDLVVSFQRQSKSGFDVALWTHEDLQEYGGESPHALTPGTGPKYLELPMLLRVGAYMRLVKSVLAGRQLKTDLQHASKITRKAGKFTVDSVKIALPKLTGTNYYGGFLWQ